ncbi:hypothetical protein AB9P05_10545 [Roseivirga sp. BDSF3-8]|uniref:hypothetical protein n=1 Tax=Roseivirga sp. BDSF3-8 TaxID=3241598 RepID=UPI0035327549
MIELLIELKWPVIVILILIGASFFIKYLYIISLNKMLEYKKLQLNKDLETFKGYITKETERYKNDLEHLRLEYEIKYSRLHQDRASIVQSLYGKLIHLRISMERMTAPLKYGSDENEREREENALINNATDRFDDFSVFYEVNKLIFPSDICELIEEIKDTYYDAIFDYMEPVRFQKMGVVDKKDLIEPRKKAIEAGKTIREKVPAILGKIEQHFRLYLGVDDPSAVTPPPQTFPKSNPASDY